MKNFLARFISHGGQRIVSAAIRFIIVTLALKNLKIDQFANLAIYMSVVEIGKVCADFGSEGYLYSKIRSNLGPMSIVASRILFERRQIAKLVSITIGLFAVFRGDYDLLPFSMSVYLSIYLSNFYFSLQKNINFKLYNRLTIIGMVAGLVSVAISYATIPSVLVYSFVLIMPDLLLYIFVSRQLVANVKSFTYTELRKHFISDFRRIRYSGLTNVGSIAYSRIDVTILRDLYGAVGQGIYSASMRFTEPIMQIFGLIIIPLVSELSCLNQTALKLSLVKIYSLKNTIFYIFASIFAGVLVGFLFRDICIYFLKIDEEIVMSAVILIFTIPLRVGCQITSTFLQSLGQFKIVMQSTYAAMVIALSLIYVLNDWLDIRYVGICILVADSVNFTYQRYNLRKICLS